MNLVNSYMAVVFIYGLLYLAFSLQKDSTPSLTSLILIFLGLGHFIAQWLKKDGD